jgi:hypothetical protein
LDGWVYGYLEEFNSGGFGKDCPAAVEPPRFNSWIVGASVALGVLGWGLFIGGYNKSKSRTAVLKINGL